MEPKLQPVSISGRPASLPGGTGSLGVDRNRVLRNTYWLLALSLVPVVGGAWLGMQLDFLSLFKAAPIMTPLLMFAAMLGSLFVVTRLRDSAWGVAALLGFTFISGVFLTPILSVAAGLRNGGQLVALAGGMTAAIFFAMATIATVTKRDFSFMGKFLFIGLILVIVASLANLFFQVPALSLTISAVAVLLFSAYLLFDVSRIVNGGETNYVMATLSIFLSLYNLFVSLLNLLMAFSGQRD
ncbi:MAG: Bax inhibitor-1/YccA family protein [Betaproteobacteria bacterium]